MKNTPVNSTTENMHPLVEYTFIEYGNWLRRRCPGITIRNAAVYRAGVKAFSRLGYIRLVDGRREIPADLPDFLVRTIKRTKQQPIWVPGPNFPKDACDVLDRLRPSFQNGEIVWGRTPARREPLKWRRR
jgi:hypothetical protein